MDIGHGIRPRGYYIQQSGGLFPAPLPQDSPDIDRVTSYFTLLGTFLAKSLQDNRLVDIPLSLSFLKLMCSGGVNSISHCPQASCTSQHSGIGLDDSLCSKGLSGPSDTTNELDQPSLEDNQNTINKLDSRYSKEDELIKDEELLKEEESELKKNKESTEDVSLIEPTSCWYSGLLDMIDLSTIDPVRAKFLENLKQLVRRRDEVMKDETLSNSEKQAKVQNLKYKTSTGVECDLEDLG